MTGPQPTTAADRTTSGRPSTAPPSAIDGFGLTGRSALPDPATHAYRKDLADSALAGLVIASHYADPLVRHLVAPATMTVAPDGGSDIVANLEPGAELRLLDIARGWAWGYGPDGRVGYVPADTVGI